MHPERAIPGDAHPATIEHAIRDADAKVAVTADRVRDATVPHLDVTRIAIDARNQRAINLASIEDEIGLPFGSDGPNTSHIHESGVRARRDVHPADGGSRERVPEANDRDAANV